MESSRGGHGGGAEECGVDTEGWGVSIERAHRGTEGYGEVQSGYRRGVQRDGRVWGEAWRGTDGVMAGHAKRIWRGIERHRRGNEEVWNGDRHGAEGCYGYGGRCGGA